MEVRKDLVAVGALLTFGLISSTTIFARAIQHRTTGEISVKGYAERRITSDLGVWRGRYSVRGKELVSTYDQLKKQSATVMAWLKKEGVVEKAMELSAVNTQTVYKLDSEGRTTNEIEGYVLTQSIDVEGNDIALLSRIAKESTQLIESGIEFDSDRPLWFYTKLNDLKIEMLGEAAHDARVRAEKIADQGDGSVGQLRSADQGVFQITAPTSTEVSGYGELDTSSITKSVKAIVTVRYAVD